MTAAWDEDYADRLEEAVLGALLYEPDQLRQIAATSEHFSNTTYRAVFDAIGEFRGVDPDVHGIDLIQAVATRVHQDKVRPAVLMSLALSCPHPEDAVGESRRLIADKLLRAASDAERYLYNLTHDLGDDLDDDFGDYTSLRDAAIRYIDEMDPEFNPARDHKEPMYWRSEETILSGLIQHPEIVPEIAQWMPPKAFPSANRRDLYQTILALDDLAPMPTTGFDLAAEINGARAAIQVTGSADCAFWVPGIHDRTTYTQHLGLVGTDPATSMKIARALLEDLTTRNDLDQPPSADLANVRQLTLATTAVDAGRGLSAERTLLAMSGRPFVTNHLRQPIVPSPAQIRLEPPY